MGALTHAAHSIFIIFGVILSVSSIPYSKYGRQCSDIGCLSSQVCVMAYDSCSYDQRDGKECGRYPTCKKNTDPSVTSGGAPDNSDFDTNTFNVKPTTTKRPSAPSFEDRKPYSPPPTYPPYNPSNNGFAGNGGGGYTPPTQPPPMYGGGGYSKPTQPPMYGGGGGYTKPTTAPTSSGGGFFNGLLSGIQNALKGYVAQQITHAITGGPGAAGSGSSGGIGGLFDTRKLIESRLSGGSLFSENKSPPHTLSSNSQKTSSASAGGGYPTQPPLQQNPYNTNYNQNNRGSNLPYPTSGNYKPSAPTATQPTYGWKLN